MCSVPLQTLLFISTPPFLRTSGISELISSLWRASCNMSDMIRAWKLYDIVFTHQKMMRIDTKFRFWRHSSDEAQLWLQPLYHVPVPSRKMFSLWYFHAAFEGITVLYTFWLGFILRRIFVKKLSDLLEVFFQKRNLFPSTDLKAWTSPTTFPTALTIWSCTEDYFSLNLIETEPRQQGKSVYQCFRVTDTSSKWSWSTILNRIFFTCSARKTYCRALTLAHCINIYISLP